MAAREQRPVAVVSSSNGAEQRVIGCESIVAGVEEFRGIPYGIVPARWQHAQLRTHLPRDELDASCHGPRCPQPSAPNNTATYQSHLDFPTGVSESEFDCLNLLITRPQALDHSRRSALLPVFVWIHGGAYGFGSASDPMWNPARLVAQSLKIGKPMIAVLINYRLNVFGFAASSSIIATQPGSSVRGCNFGLGDQRVALEWISKNIAYFGGDPDKVTIGGQSAGASSTHAHLLETWFAESKPLFRRVTIQSGAVGVLGPIPLETVEQSFLQLAKIANVGELAPDEQVMSLLDLNAEELLRCANEMDWQVFPLVNDGLTIKPAAGYQRWAISFGRAGRYDSSPNNDSCDSIAVLIGDTESEASIWYDQIHSIQNISHVERAFAARLSSSEAAEGLRLYSLNEASSLSALHQAVTQLLTDVEFGYPVHLARKACQHSDSPVVPAAHTQTYRLKCGNPWQGIHHNVAQHCIDLIYLFDCFYRDMEAVEKDALAAGEYGHIALVNEIQKMWIDFVSDEDPLKFPPHLTFVVEADRSVKLLDKNNDPDWIKRQLRFDWIARNESHVRDLLPTLLDDRNLSQ